MMNDIMPWNDVGDGISLVVGRLCFDLIGGGPLQVLALRQ